MKSGRYSLSMILAISMSCFLAAAQQSATTQSSAPVPRLVNFTGKAADAQGKPISGIAGVTFAIYKDQYEGAPLWLEPQNIQADAKGNYTAQLGATKPNGLPLDLFSSGDARWLGVTVNGGQEQPRVLLLSVPYALKAADAETIGGLPPSAFVLAAPPVSTSMAGATSQGATVQPLVTGTSPVTTAGGTQNLLPKFDATADITTSQIFDNGTNVGIGNTAPAAKLDVSGTGIFRGLLSLPATGTATATAGKNSQPFNFTASSFNSGTAGAVNQVFRWQAEAAGNNTTTPSGMLNLLYGSGIAVPTETGLHINNKGVITFASAQTFPAAGTVSSVGLSAPSSDFTVTGSPVTKSGTLNLNWNVAPTSTNTVNAIVKRDAAGNFSAGGISTLGLTATNTVFPMVATMTGNTPQTAAVTGTATATGIGNTYGVAGYSSTGNGVGVFGQANSNIGLYGTGAVGVFGTGSSFGFQTDSNVSQARTGGGWVKGMVLVNGITGAVIERCFNSTLTGPASTTPPCGFVLTQSMSAQFYVDFGFEVDDRFFSATLYTWVGGTAPAIGVTPLGAANPNAVAVFTWNGSDGVPFDFYLVVF